MSKLEEKLIELGYNVSQDINGVFTATKIDDNTANDFIIKICENKIVDYYAYSLTRRFQRQKQLDNLQQAFNILKQDLEVLREYE